MPKIWGKLENLAVEEIDDLDSIKEAHRMLREYIMDYSADWTLWVGKKYPIPRTQNLT